MTRIGEQQREEWRSDGRFVPIHADRIEAYYESSVGGSPYLLATDPITNALASLEASLRFLLHSDLVIR